MRRLPGSCSRLAVDNWLSTTGWGSRESIAITAVMGSQFAALAAVAAFMLFGERLGRMQVVGVVLIVAGVTVLAGVSA